MTRIGIFGGTFDPVHQGHLILAEQCREQAMLDEIWFLPAASPPHKQSVNVTRFEQRVEMLSLALAGNPHFKIEQIENEREGLSYTADTLAALHERHENAEFFLLLGSDSLADLPGWYEPERILSLASLVVLRRADHPIPEEVPDNVEWVHSPPLIDISSTDLRQRVEKGRSIRYLVPKAVECYIHEKKLYVS